MKKKSIISLCIGLVMFFLAMPAMAQNQSVSGTVVDNNGEPIIGASVQVKGTANGVVTDLDGNFKMSVPAKQKITVSYIGYVTQTLNAGTNME